MGQVLLLTVLFRGAMDFYMMLKIYKHWQTSSRCFTGIQLFGNAWVNKQAKQLRVGLLAEEQRYLSRKPFKKI